MGDNASANKLERKIDDICDTVAKIDKEVCSLKAILTEREKAEILRNEVIIQAMKIQEKSLEKRVDKVEDNQTWVMRAIVGTVFGLIATAVTVVIKLVQ